MRKLILILVISFWAFGCVAQQNSLKGFPVKSDTTFNNQGEQENYWAKQYFLFRYTLQHRAVYNAKIKINLEGRFVFDSDTIAVDDKDSVFKAILSNGLIYPVLLRDFSIWKSKRGTLTNLKELTFLSQVPTVKRFRFLEWGGYMASPTVYLIEITNKHANSKTSLLDFVKGAELTFIADAWVQI